MLGNFDRVVVLGLWVIGISILGLFALFQHHEQHAVEQVWSSRQQASVVTGAVGSSAATANVEPERAVSDEREATVETTSSVDGPDAADELDSSPREESLQTSSVVTRKLPPTATRSLPTTQQPGRPALRKHAAPQSTERAVSAQDNSAEIDQAKSPRRDAILPVQPAMTNPALSALPADETSAPAIESQPGPVDASSPSLATPPPKSRQDVQDELRKARLNGSLPRFGNPDPYGPGGSPSSVDR
ncbi:hypothetical protein AWB80_07840 [Caballeronia pedi]|uniref:DUF4148 domain-containing protein n=1 Tax=Caballeronia pedi TaxID=1777141 RepID=A0A158E0K6_9BURK|nr:hypothetical protein [Caballeronia pedi]SAL00303.1 hypothetical protein AWB80_07840 [Caballeronia pedi]